MRPFIIKSAIIALSLTVISDMALARVPSTTALPNNWTGAYGGINIGGVFNDANLKSNNLGFIGLSSTCNMNSNFSSFFSGVQAGYAYQFDSKVVLGVEGDYTYNSSQTGRAKCPCPFTPGVSDGFSFKNRQQGSVRGRIGYALNHNLLPFLSAGDSFADLGMNYLNEAGDHYSKSSTKSGWLAGAGLDWGFSPGWSLRVEYFYTDYGTMNMLIPTIYDLYDPNGGAHVNLTANNVKASVNYWF